MEIRVFTTIAVVSMSAIGAAYYKSQIPLYTPMALLLSSDLPRSITLHGFSGIESWGRWTEGDQASITLLQKLPKNFELTIEGRAFGPNAGQVTTIVCGKVKQPLLLTGDLRSHTLKFTEVNSNVIVFEIPQPTAPSALGNNTDSRKLGIGLTKLTIDPSSTQQR